MRYELSDDEWAAIKPMLPNKAAGRTTGGRSACPQWHLLGLAVRSAVARSAW
jgi:transposase